MEIYGIIPARYQSTRLPGKPLAIIGGKPMIQRVYEQCIKSGVLKSVTVATDDERIADIVKSFNGNVILTNPSHPSGTDRCFEAAQKLGLDNNAVVINIQGDEPFINPEQIDLLAGCFDNDDTQIATLVKTITNAEDLDNPGIAKVVVGANNNALYFSRSPIPFVRNAAKENWLAENIYYKHIGIYGYTYKVLKQLVDLKQSPLELAESLEQLRWLEHGFNIAVKVTEYENFAIDTPTTLKLLTKWFSILQFDYFCG
ncbi:MAG: 3-deoxy-manno-octulosonate cytidylyltransferase [Sphingobacteriales bacterium JAD_PAG50586_3]|nr:MAG: 3-deoxy-manno-octulosonate cytidylyltransferase [Sphingobacteriales bacterium JAD_PAG50586_3]